jgi:hypothetical protein
MAALAGLAATLFVLGAGNYNGNGLTVLPLFPLANY